MAFWWALEHDQKLAVLTQTSPGITHSGAPPKMGRPPKSIPAKQTVEESSINVRNDPEPKAMIIGTPNFNHSLIQFSNHSSFLPSLLDSPPLMKENTEEVLDTNLLSEKMKNAMKKEGMTLKSFSKIFNVNRNYIGTLINKPIPIDQTTPLQR